MNKEKIKAGSHTITGDREYQQDLCAYDRQGNMFLAVLCDGMGGMDGGEIASRIGVQLALDMFQDMPPAGIYGAAQWMQEFFVWADAEIANLHREDGEPVHSGSTGVLVMIEDDKMQWGSVGDSRIYLRRVKDPNKGMHVITRMHNYNMMLDNMQKAGQITEAERMRMSGGQGEALISYLGIGGLKNHIIDCGKLISLEEGDVIVLCSDGVYKALDDPQVNAIIEECGGDMEIAAHRIVDEAYRLAKLKRISKQDNTTAIAIRYGRWMGWERIQ